MIKNEDEYRKVLSQFDILFDSNDTEKLSKLADEIEEYENIHYPMDGEK